MCLLDGKGLPSQLSAKDWFVKVRKADTHIWAPPPGGLIALEEITKAKHKCPYTQTHVLLIPHLLYQEKWRRQFEKEMDIWFVFNHGTVWPHSTFEPHIIGISCLLSYPWEL